MKCFYIIASLIFVNCSTNTVNYDQKLENIPFIPLPQVIESSNLFISVSELSSIQTEIKSERIEAALKDFTNFWEQQTSNEIVINPNLNNSLKSIHLDLDYNSETSKEFYQLEINEKGIINIGGKKQSIYSFAKKFNKKVKKVKLKKNLNIPLNQTMSLKKLKKLL